MAALMGLMGLWGCSGNDLEGPQSGQMPISFAGNMQKETAVSRADKGLEEMLDSKTFKAWGYKNMTVSGNDYTDYQAVMSGYNVIYEANSASVSNTCNWEYVNESAGQYIKYWDFSAAAYRFFAYALGNGTPTAVSEDMSDPSKAVFSSSVSTSSDATIDAAPYFSELWFSNDKQADYGQVVTLRFVKPFARVRFLFKFADNLRIGRESLHFIRFYPNPTTEESHPVIPTSGSVVVDYPLRGTATQAAWKTIAASGISQFDIDWYEAPAPVTLPAGVPADALPTTWPNTPEKWYNVLPAPNQGSYNVEVQVMSGEIKTATVPAEFMSWKPGYQYTYVFKITEQGGVAIDVIQVAVNDWNRVMTLDHEVYNW